MSRTALRYTFERYDGGGLPGGVHGDAIPVAMRVAQVADMVEVHHRTGGVEGAVAMVRARRGGQFDPVIADAFIGDAERILAGPTVGDSWAAALHEAPDRGQRIDGAELDALLEALGDFVDLKCPFTLGHSRAVGELAADAVATAGLDNATVTLTRRAGHVHDLGRIGVSNQIWSKPAALTAAEFERVRLHPYLTVRILSRVSGLEQVVRAGRKPSRVPQRRGLPARPARDRPWLARPDSGRRCLLPVRAGAQAVPGAHCRRRTRRAGCRRGSAPANSILPQSMPFCTRPAMVIVTPTRGPTASPRGRSRCCDWSPRVRPTRRSPRHW